MFGLLVFFIALCSSESTLICYHLRCSGLPGGLHCSLVCIANAVQKKKTETKKRKRKRNEKAKDKR
jgi:hypothetical protein